MLPIHGQVRDWLQPMGFGAGVSHQHGWKLDGCAAAPWGCAASRLSTPIGEGLVCRGWGCSPYMSRSGIGFNRWGSGLGYRISTVGSLMAVPLRPGVAQRRGFLRLTPGLRLPAGITRGAILGSVEILLLPRHQAAAAQPSLAPLVMSFVLSCKAVTDRQVQFTIKYTCASIVHAHTRPHDGML